MAEVLIMNRTVKRDVQKVIQTENMLDNKKRTQNIKNIKKMVRKNSMQ